ncbi:MAG: SPOR domain-containing protein [Rhodospirillaceae bacterium]
MTSQWNDLEFDPAGFGPPGRPPRRRDGMTGKLGRAVFVLAALGFVGGAVWFGLRYSSRVTDESGLPLVRADLRPYKSKPVDAGGMTIPDQDKLVFRRLDPDGEPPPVERLLPEPEVPLARPVAPPPPPPGAEPSAQAAAPRYLPDSKLQPPPIPQEPSTRTIVAAPPAEPVKPATPPAKVAATPPAPPKVAATPPAPAKATAAGGSYKLQLGAVRSEADAGEEWQRLKKRFPDLLGALSMKPQRADLGDKGVFFRLLTSPMDEAKARSLCDQLKGRGLGCQLARTP